MELFSKGLERLGYDPLPTHREPPESPVSTPEVAREFPYVLTTGSRRREFFHSEHRQIPPCATDAPTLWRNCIPRLAARHGIADGDWVWVVSPRGRIRMKALVTEDIREDVVNVDHGWWFPEREARVRRLGVQRQPAHRDTPPYDPAFGSYQLRGLLCALEKAESGG